MFPQRWLMLQLPRRAATAAITQAAMTGVDTSFSEKIRLQRSRSIAYLLPLVGGCWRTQKENKKFLFKF